MFEIWLILTKSRPLLLGQTRYPVRIYYGDQHRTVERAARCVRNTAFQSFNHAQLTFRLCHFARNCLESWRNERLADRKIHEKWILEKFFEGIAPRTVSGLGGTGVQQPHRRQRTHRTPAQLRIYAILHATYVYSPRRPLTACSDEERKRFFAPKDSRRLIEILRSRYLKNITLRHAAEVKNKGKEQTIAGE